MKRVAIDHIQTDVCSLSLVLWSELVYKRLDVFDLIHLSQTCSAFAQCRRLLQLIKTHTAKMFGRTQSKHWNRMEERMSNRSMYDFCKITLGNNVCAVLISTYMGSPIPTTFSFGVFLQSHSFIKQLISRFLPLSSDRSTYDCRTKTTYMINYLDYEESVVDVQLEIYNISKDYIDTVCAGIEEFYEMMRNH